MWFLSSAIKLSVSLVLFTIFEMSFGLAFGVCHNGITGGGGGSGGAADGRRFFNIAMHWLMLSLST